MQVCSSVCEKRGEEKKRVDLSIRIGCLDQIKGFKFDFNSSETGRTEEDRERRASERTEIETLIGGQVGERTKRAETHWGQEGSADRTGQKENGKTGAVETN